MCKTVIRNTYSADSPEYAPFRFQLGDSRIFYVLKLEVLVDVRLIYVHSYRDFTGALRRCVRATRDPLTPSSARLNTIIHLTCFTLIIF